MEFSRRFSTLLLSVCVASLPLLAIDTHEPAPRFHAKTADGESYDNDSVKGKVVLLQFWATWCKYCRADQEHVDDIAKEFADKGLLVLAVNSGEAKKVVKKYLDSSPRSCKIVMMQDTNLAALFPTTGFPLYVVIDRQGKIAGTQRGAGGEDALRALIAKAGLDSE